MRGHIAPMAFMDRVYSEEMRQAAIALLCLGFFVSVVTQVAERWKAVLADQHPSDKLQTHLWGWDAARKPLQDASRKVLWASYLRLGAAFFAVTVLIAAAARVMGFATGVACLMPAFSLGGTYIYREFGTLTVAQVHQQWHSGELATKVLAWLAKGGPMASSSYEPLPTIVLTGFLGAGKTTLLNRVLREGRDRGRKFAVIENEVGAVGIDGQLLAEGMTAKERADIAPTFVELSDGCVCCTVRGDLQEALQNLLPKLREQGVDTLLLETTGLAEPGPVVQTFLADPVLRKGYRVDGVVTVVDAKHVMQHLESSEAIEERRARGAGTASGRDDDAQKGAPLSAQVRQLSATVLRLKQQQQMAKQAMMQASAAMSQDPKSGEKAAKAATKEVERVDKELKDVRAKFTECRAQLRAPKMGGRKSEAAQQIAFADKVIINKIDLVSDDDAADVNTAIATINPHAEVITASNAVVDFDWVLAPRPLTADEEPPAAAADASKDASDDDVCKPCAPGGATAKPPDVTTAGYTTSTNKPWHGPKGGVPTPGNMYT